MTAALERLVAATRAALDDPELDTDRARADAIRPAMQALLFDVSGTYREAGLPRVESLEELSTHLGC